jgi:hypothetical protein
MKGIETDSLGRRKRRVFSLAQKRALVLRFGKEGGIARDFSRTEGLTYSAFLKWIKQFSSEPGAFLPVRLCERPPVPGGAVMEVHLGNGRRIHIMAGFDTEAVAQLVRLLEQPC